MKERPILFNAPMVRALLDDTKMQTRRVCKVAEATALSYVVDCGGGQFGDEEGYVRFASPYGQPGDCLWARETFFAYGRWETRYSEKKKRDEWHFVDMTLECDRIYQYAADNPDVPLAKGRGVTPGWWTRPAIFMPRAASRILLEVVSVRVERLQDISAHDCHAEGIGQCDGLGSNAEILDLARRMGTCTDEVLRYATLWEQINGAGSWVANPWVWVVEFKRVAP